MLPGAQVVKAFNTLFADTMTGAPVDGQPLTMFVASDHEEARNEALNLGTQLGYETVDAGPLRNARYLEPMGELLIQLGYGQGLGTRLGFALRNGSST